jgi:hypothetical protein
VPSATLSALADSRESNYSAINAIGDPVGGVFDVENLLLRRTGRAAEQGRGIRYDAFGLIWLWKF